MVLILRKGEEGKCMNRHLQEGKAITWARLESSESTGGPD